MYTFLNKASGNKYEMRVQMKKSQKSIVSTLNQQIQLSELLRLLLTKWYWIAGTGILGFLLVFACTKFWVTPQYESYITMYVYNNPEMNTSTGTVNNNDLQAAESLAGTYTVILQSNVVYDAVADTVNGLHPSGIRQPLTREDLQDIIDITTIDGMQILEISATTSDPELSYWIADAFAKVAPEQIVKITKAGAAEVVDQAESNPEPVSPNVVLDSLIGLAAGLFLAAAWLIFRMISDTTICTADDIEDVVEVPLLGAIPKLSANDGKNSKTLSIRTGGAIEYGGKKHPKNKNEIEAWKESKQSGVPSDR